MADPLLVILAAPYSHASLVSAMLDRHPEMTALPDTNLFVADNLKAVLEKHSGMGKGVNDGLLRLLAQLHDGKQTDEAIQAVKDWLAEHGEWTARQLLDSVYDQLQPGLLIDASPANAMNEENLQRLYRAFPDASFLHLTRHPRSVAVSCIEARDSRENAYIREGAGADEEQIWLGPNSVISEFAMSLPEGQCMRLMVEDLLDDAGNYLLQIAQWLGLGTDKKSISAMTHPEKMFYAKYGPPLAPCGMEADFLEQPTMPVNRQPVSLVEASAPSEIEFSARTLKLAREFGYQ